MCNFKLHVADILRKSSVLTEVVLGFVIASGLLILFFSGSGDPVRAIGLAYTYVTASIGIIAFGLGCHNYIYNRITKGFSLRNYRKIYVELESHKKEAPK